jgi:hypothetical protein
MIYALIFSIVLNVVLIWYIKNILTKLFFVSENIDDLLHTTKEFSEHLTGLYGLETFYGEPVLENLVHHSKLVVEEIKRHHSTYSLLEEEPDLEEDEEEEEEEIDE